MGWSSLFLVASCLVCFSLGSLDPTLLPGHLKPFGDHMAPMPLEETEEIPDAKTFFQKYVLPSRPIVFRGAAKKFKAFSKWTEEYLVEKYGDMEVRLENKLEKEGYTPAGSKGVGRDTMEEFIKTYKTQPKYIVGELPTPMYEDIMALPCMSCGPVKNRMVEVDLWMSSGSSQSILHKDAFNTMNCLINGTKDWKLVLYKHEKDLYKAWEEGSPGGGYSRINVRAVNMTKFPKIATLPYYNITVHGGDCLFLPKSCYHQVNSLPGFNLAVTILFSRFDNDKPNNFKDCNSTTEKYTPLKEFDIDWMYPGKGYMTMGYSETFGTKSQMAKLMRNGKLDVRTVLQTARIMTDPFTGEAINAAYVRKIFGVKKGETITKQHIRALKKKQLRKLGVLSQDLFSSSLYDYERYKIAPVQIAKLLALLVKRDGVIQRDVFIKEYVKRLYGTKKFGGELFDDLAGKGVAELDKDLMLKNFATAASKYMGDDYFDRYDPTAKMDEKEDAGEAYIYVKTDLDAPKDEKLASRLIRSLPDEGERSQGGDGEEEDEDDSIDEEAEGGDEEGDGERDGGDEGDEGEGEKNSGDKNMKDEL